jgi:hypothetical protein
MARPSPRSGRLKDSFLNEECSAVRFTDYGSLLLRDPSSELLGYFQLSAVADKGDVLTEIDCKGDFET